MCTLNIISKVSMHKYTQFIVLNKFKCFYNMGVWAQGDLYGITTNIIVISKVLLQAGADLKVMKRVNCPSLILKI